MTTKSRLSTKTTNRKLPCDTRTWQTVSWKETHQGSRKLLYVCLDFFPCFLSIFRNLRTGKKEKLSFSTTELDFFFFFLSFISCTLFCFFVFLVFCFFSFSFFFLLLLQFYRWGTFFSQSFWEQKNNFATNKQNSNVSLFCWTDHFPEIHPSALFDSRNVKSAFFAKPYFSGKNTRKYGLKRKLSLSVSQRWALCFFRFKKLEKNTFGIFFVRNDKVFPKFWKVQKIHNSLSSMRQKTDKNSWK